MKVVIIGASRGLGFLLVKKFLENGNQVVAGSRKAELTPEYEEWKLNNK